MYLSIAYIVISLTGLYFGANWLVKGASSMAVRFGVTPLVIGLTVVAFGSSTPELIVSVQSSLKGFGSIAVGNAMGSNIANIGVILGISALICPLRTNLQLIRFDAPVMLLTIVIFILMFLDNRISRLEGLILVILLVGYIVFNVSKSRKETRPEVLSEFSAVVPKVTRHWGLDLLLILAGFGMLMLGAHYLVKGAVDLARMIGLSEAVIGLTVVSLGTSMPELAISVVAAIKKQTDIAIGNVVGSNIFNILCTLGVAATIRPIDAPGISLVDSLVMLGLSLLLLPLIKTGYILKRWEGGVFLSVYLAYMVYLLR